jgi:hypothetical protein
VCKAIRPLYPQRSKRNSPLRTTGGVLLLVVSAPLVVGPLIALIRILSQREMEERQSGFVLIAVLALLVATPLVLAGLRLARGDLLLVCAECRTPQRN